MYSIRIYISQSKRAMMGNRGIYRTLLKRIKSMIGESKANVYA